MLAASQILSSLLYLTISYILIAFQNRDNSKNRRSNMIIASILIVTIFVAKLGFDMQSLSKSKYAILQVSRHSTTLDIRRSYKKLSKIYHPDKNPDSLDAQNEFHNIKIAYDILMDEEHRDIYNRFGSESIHFDPRKDEMKLISDIAVVYLFWIIVSYVMTLPLSARASRTWIIIIGICILAAEVMLTLTETSLPTWMIPEYLTESELIFILHGTFPLLIALCRCLSEYLYVDIDVTSIAVLKQLYSHQKAMNDVLIQLQSLIDVPDRNKETSDGKDGNVILVDPVLLENVQSKVNELRDEIELACDNTTHYIEDLANCSNNPGSSYYWLIFVIMYGSVYFMQ